MPDLFSQELLFGSSRSGVLTPASSGVSYRTVRPTTGALASELKSILFSSGELGWLYDNTNPATLFQDQAGTFPVSAAGQIVRRQLDLSGLGNHRINPTADTNAPVWSTDPVGRPGLLFDGVNDWLETENNLNPATDKCQIFGVYRKLNDTASIVIEFSPNVNTNAGSFYLVAGVNGAVPSGWHSASRGNAVAAPGQSAAVTTYLGADTAIITATHDIAGNLSTIRREGVVGLNATGAKGTGNFGTYKAYFGARGGSTVWWNGYVLGLEVVRFGPNLTSTQIAQIEALINQSC